MGTESISLDSPDSSKTVLVPLDDIDRPVYHLSGIAQNGYGIKIIVPKDRNLAVLGHPRLGGR